MFLLLQQFILIYLTEINETKKKKKERLIQMSVKKKYLFCLKLLLLT